MREQHQWFCGQVEAHKTALYRLARRQRTISLEDCGVEPAVPPADAGDSLWPLVQTLPDTLRAPVTLFYYDDLTAAQIAAILGIQEGAVRTRLTRGRQMLKEILEEEALI